MSILVLLVGMNPLPNWVVFESLTNTAAPRERHPEAVWLIHSLDTTGPSEWLRKAIAARGVPAERLELSRPRDGVAIGREMQGRIARLGSDTAIHLNYTGGTKEMAVSVFTAFDQASRKGRIRAFSSSYLDAGEHKLRFDDGAVLPPALDLRHWVSISLAELLAMHGRHLETEEERTRAAPLWLKTSRTAWELATSGYEAEPLSGAWAPLRGLLRGGSTDGSEGAIALTLPTDGTHAPLADAIREDLTMPPSRAAVTWPDLYSYYGAGTSKQRQRVRKRKVPSLFGGAWLEVWLWQQLHRLIQERANWPLHHSVTATSTSGTKNAEIDVALLCGYQLFVFSCTTDVQRAKEKAFEVIHRAQQYGGEEARPVLVAPLTDGQVDVLQADLESDFGSAGKLRIWGLEEMRRIDEEWERLLMDEGLQ